MIYKCQTCLREFPQDSEEVIVTFKTGEPSLECPCGGDVKAVQEMTAEEILQREG
jgi:DNA-directed RNA polymerase subunit RPC12/RpoP